MGPVDEIQMPVSEEEAVDTAVRMVLKAAQNLCLAAELAEEGDPVAPYINAALHLRDLASMISPGASEWPSEGAEIYDIVSKQKLN